MGMIKTSRCPGQAAGRPRINVPAVQSAMGRLHGGKGKRSCRKFGVLEDGLQIRDEGGLLVPDLTFDEEASGGASLFAILIGQGTRIDQAKGQVMDLFARKAGRQGFFQQLKDALGRGGCHGCAPIVMSPERRITWGSGIKSNRPNSGFVPQPVPILCARRYTRR